MIGDAGYEKYLNAGEDLWFISEPTNYEPNDPNYKEPEVLENVTIWKAYDKMYFKLDTDWQYASFKIDSF